MGCPLFFGAASLATPFTASHQSKPQSLTVTKPWASLSASPRWQPPAPQAKLGKLTNSKRKIQPQPWALLSASGLARNLLHGEPNYPNSQIPSAKFNRSKALGFALCFGAASLATSCTASQSIQTHKFQAQNSTAAKPWASLSASGPASLATSCTASQSIQTHKFQAQNSTAAKPWASLSASGPPRWEPPARRAKLSKLTNSKRKIQPQQSLGLRSLLRGRLASNLLHGKPKYPNSQIPSAKFNRSKALGFALCFGAASLATSCTASQSIQTHKFQAQNSTAAKPWASLSASGPPR